MARTHYSKTQITGGVSSSIDGIDGDSVIDGDIVFAHIGEKLYTYKLDDDLVGTEKSPFIIKPDTNGTTKTWVLQDIIGAVGHGHGIYDFDVDGGVAGVFVLDTIPDNSTIIHARYEVVTQPTSGGAASIALGVGSVDESGITGASSYAGANFAAGYFDTLPDGKAANFTSKTTAEQNVIMTISTAALTAGLIHVWYDFVTSE